VVQIRGLWGGDGVVGERGTFGTREFVHRLFWGYNPVCKVTPVMLHGVVSPVFPDSCPTTEHPRNY